MLKTQNELNISDAEWEVMRIIWTLNHAGSSQIIDQLQEKMTGLNQLLRPCLDVYVKKDT